MVFGSIESCKDLHRIDDFSLLLSLLPLELLSLFEIKQASLDHELLPSDSFIKSRIVQFNDIILQLNVCLSVVVKELHVSKEQVGIHVVLLLEIPPFRHVPNNFRNV